MKHFMCLYRIQIANQFKVAIKVFNKDLNSDPLSITIVDEVPKGLTIGVKYNLAQ